MRGRGGLAIAVLILPALAVICLALAVTLIGAAGESLRQSVALLAGLPAPAPHAARVARHALEGAAVVTLCCIGVAWVAGWALGRLPEWWAALATAMLCYPALAVVFAWVLSWLVLLPWSGPLGAVAGAGAALRWPLGSRVLLIAVLAPPLAMSVVRAWRAVDPVALRAAETCGIGAARRFVRLVFPELMGPLVDGAVLVFLISVAVLAIRAPALPLAINTAGMGALAAILAAAVLGAALIWGAVSQRRPA